MPRRAFADGAPPVSAAALNAVWEQGFITAADQAEMDGYLVAATVGGKDIPPVAIGALCLRLDNDVIYRVNASRAWAAFLDIRGLQTLGRPWLDFYTSTNTKTGRLGVHLGTPDTIKQFMVYDETDAAWFRVQKNTAGRVDIRAVAATGTALTSLDQSYGIYLTDSLTELRATLTALIKAGTIQLQDPITATLAPLITLGNTPAGPNRMLGTDASGRVAALAMPTSYPAFLPDTIGQPGQGLVVNAGGTVVEWSDNVGSGGGGTPLESFFTPSLPAATRSAVGETQINIAAGTLADDHPFSVSSNGIVVASGTEPFAATLDYVLDINPTAWVTPGTGANQGARAPGNRLFVDVYWKKDGVIMTDTRISHYIRGDEDWAPSDHKLHGVFSEIMAPGTWTLWINRTVAAGGGNEISGYEIVAANSDIHIVSGTGPPVAGVGLRDVLAQTTYAAATAGSANTSGTQALPNDFGTNNPFVYLQVGLDQNYTEATLIATGFLTSLTGSAWVAVEGIAAGNIEYQPSTRSLRVTRTGRNPRLMYVGLVGRVAAGSGSTTFLGLTDTPDAFEDGKWLRQTASGLESVDAPAGTFTPTADSIPASAARASTAAYRQEWAERLDFLPDETITSNSFVMLAGFSTTPALTGFITSPVVGSINGGTSPLAVSIGSTRYEISALYQVNAAGGTDDNIVLRISPDPAADISAEWQLQIGALLFNFSDATTATDAGGRVSYSWTGNKADIFEGGQSYNCALRIPSVEQFATLPIQFSQISGTADPSQFRDSSIVYTRAIGATLTDQAGWRGKAGFAAFSNAGNRFLAYINNQVVQAQVDVYDLANVVPTANLVAPAANQIAIWTTSGLDSVATLGRNHLPPGTATGQVLEWDGTAWQLITTPSGGTGGVSTFAGLSGRFTWAQGPAVSAVDNGKIVGVTGGTLQLYEPALSGFGSGNLPTSRLSGNLSALRVDFAGLTTNQQNAIKAALNITSGAAATIMFGAIGTPELDLYTTGSTASSFTYDQTKREEFIRALGLTREDGYTRYEGTLTAATTPGGDVGFSATSPMVGSMTGTRDIEVGGNPVRIEAILYGQTGGQDSLSLYFSGTITETPNVILLVNGQSFNANTADTSASDSSYGAAGWVISWNDIPLNLLVTGTNYNVEIAGGIEAEVEAELGNIRQLPALPGTTEKKVLAANNAGATYETLSLDGADEASFLLNVTATNKANQDTTVIPVSGSGVAAYFTRSGNYLTARKAGWSHVALTVYPGSANTGQVKIHARVSNRDVLRSDRTVEHYRDVISWIFPYNFAVGDTLSFWYEARDVPTSASASGVPAIPAFTVTEDDANYKDTIAISSPSTGLFNYIQISKRVHGAGTTQWTDWETLEARVSSFTIRRLYDLETDYRIRLGNSAGVSRYRQWLAGAGATTTLESTSAYGQTVNFNGNIHISRPSITIS